MTERITTSLGTGSKILFTDDQGRERAAVVAYVWAPGDDPHPLINLSYTKDGEPTVATSVPHKSKVPGASGRFYERPAGRTVYVTIDSEPGARLVVHNKRNNITASYPVPGPPPEHKAE